MAEIGQLIEGKYEVLKLIGKGGMSKVFLAMDTHLNKQWAIKEIQKTGRDSNNEVFVTSAIAEANLIKKLDHPSIVRITDIIEKEDVIYIVEDYIEGETLDAVLKNNGAQPQELVIEWAMQICEALEYLHTRKPPIIYRDMKPANVMLTPEGNVKIIDFGIAREYKERNLADTVSLGTKGYAAPEQYGSRGQTDARTDVYCLGATLYHLVTGMNPAEEPYVMYPIRRWNAQLSAGLEAIIIKCTQNNPADRYQSCAELLYALQHYEEYSAEYRRAQKKKLNGFIAACATFLGCAILGCTALFARVAYDNADYEENMKNASGATTLDETYNYYEAAISIKPTETEPYINFIDYIKQDEVFDSSTEKSKIDSLVSNHLNDGEMSGTDYGRINYEIGILYMYYYDYGQENDTGLQDSYTYFEKAVENGTGNSELDEMAKVYEDLASLRKQISSKGIEDGDSTKEETAEYWNDLKTIYESCGSGNISTSFKLRIYQRVLNEISNNVRTFIENGISKSEIETVYNGIASDIKTISSTEDLSTQAKEILSSIESRIDTIKEEIDNAARAVEQQQSRVG